MFHRLKDYFHFNKAERWGVISLLLVIFIVIGIKQSLVYLNPQNPEEQKNLEEILFALEEATIKRDSIKKREYENSRNTSRDMEDLPIEDFNPNTFTMEDWQQFGLSKKQVEVIQNFQESSDGFQSKAELKKVFVISDELFAILEPHILLPDTVAEKRKAKDKKEYNRKWERYNTEKSKTRIYPKINLNTADTTELKKLYGIGNYYAKKIIKRREDLGGFISKEQLKEIWGLKEETLLKIDTQLFVGEPVIEKIDINTASIEKLQKHPYIFWKQANSIVKYREQHGLYKNIEEIKNSEIINDSLFKKLEPYLKY